MDDPLEFTRTEEFLVSGVNYFSLATTIKIPGCPCLWKNIFLKQVKRREPVGRPELHLLQDVGGVLFVGLLYLLQPSLPVLLVPYRSSGYVVNQSRVAIPKLLDQEAALKIRYRINVALFPTVIEPSRVLTRDLRMDRFQATLLRVIDGHFHWIPLLRVFVSEICPHPYLPWNAGAGNLGD